MKTYTYKGKTKLIFSLGGIDYSCLPGRDYDFDSSEEYIQTLVAAKLLEEKQKISMPSRAAKPVVTKPEKEEDKDSKNS